MAPGYPPSPPSPTAEFPVPPLVVRHAIRLPQTTVVTVFVFGQQKRAQRQRGIQRQGDKEVGVGRAEFDVDKLRNKVRMMNRTEVF